MGVIVRKPRWKQLLLPEIPASRLACITSGSFRPKLGLGILALLVLGCIVLVFIPLIVTPTITSLIAVKSAKASTTTISEEIKVKMEDFDKDLARVVVHSNEKFHKGFFDNVKDTSKNQIMSSYSVSSVLGMILHGADGKTAEQLRTSLGLEEAKALDDFAKNFTLNSANRIYFAEDNSLEKTYLDSTKENFLAEPVATDFSKGEEAREAIIHGLKTKQT